MIRVLHLFNAFQLGGVERQHLSLVREMSGACRQFCWAYNQGPVTAELDRLGVPWASGPFAQALPGLRDREFDCAVLRTHMHFHEIQGFLAEARLPFVYIKDYLRWFQGNDTYLDPAFDARVCAAARQVFFCGPLLRDGVLGAGIQPCSWDMLHNGLELGRFPLEPRPRPGLGRPFTVGMLGNLIPRKNQLAALEALRPLLAQGRVRLLLGGDAHDPAYAARLWEAGTGLPVEFTGFVSDVPGFLARVDALVMTSRLEGWPVALMEAMACGVPVAAPAIGDVPELLQHGRAGLLYPDQDFAALPGLLESLADPGAYAALSAAGVERVRAFDAANCAKKVWAAVSRLVPQPVAAHAGG